MVEIELKVEAQLHDPPPLRMRQPLGSTTIDDCEIDLTLCASGANLYVEGNGKQVAIPLANILGATLHHLGLEL